MRLFDPRDSTTPLGQVIRVLQDGTIRDLGDQVDNVMPSPAAFKNDLLVLLADLHATGDLVRDFFLGHLVPILTPVEACNSLQFRPHKLRIDGSAHFGILRTERGRVAQPEC
jgi:hypothetical protein